jgi:hypothetical protein
MKTIIRLFVALTLACYAMVSFGGLTSPDYGGQPYFSAYMSAVQTVTANTNTKLNFNTVEYDSGGYYDTTNFRFLPKVAGKYVVQCSVSFTTNSAAANYSAMIYKNGSLLYGSFQNIGSGTVSQAFQTAKTAIVPLNGSTDYVECWGATGQTNVNGIINTYTNFQAYYLGP